MSINNILYAQNKSSCQTTKNKKAKIAYTEAVKKKQYNKKAAEELLREAIIDDPRCLEAFYLLGEIIFENAQSSVQNEYTAQETEKLYEESDKFLQKSIKICREYNNFEAYFILGKIAYNKKQYSEAKKELEIFISETTHFVKKLEAKDLVSNIDEYFKLTNNPVEFKPYRLPGINSIDDEYLPLISPDDELMFFTRRIYNKSDDYTETFLVSKRISDKNDTKEIFSEGIKLPSPFNDGRNQGGASITADNKNLYISICGIEKGHYSSYKNCDIYYSKKEPEGWQKLIKLNSNINGSFTFEAQPSVTANGNVLYFAAIRDNGYGGIDIYKSEKDKNGNWGEALNLGPTINTEKDDKTPFMHPDGKTLFFSSNGRFGIGGFDIYFSVFDDKTGWSKPKNIGYPINTENDELAFTVSTNGEILYFASNSINKNKGWDIYSTKMPENAKPKKVLLVKGKVKGSDGDTISEVKVFVTSIQSKKETEGYVDNSSGDYAVTVPVEKEEKFILTARKHGYVYFSEYIDTDEEEYIPPTYKDLVVDKIVELKANRLKNVNFEFDSYLLDETAKVELNALVDFMNEYPYYKISIRGHTDNSGTPAHNMELSRLRAKTVTDYIISKSINENRLDYKYYGETKALTSNSTEAGRALNRRVEFVIQK